MSSYAPDCLNSTIALQQEETLKTSVIVQDARHHHEIPRGGKFAKAGHLGMKIK
jgi:hypothetical protein